ncbi:MAG: Crp/Fnr family transcriptional regulator [Gemmatimonadaceae bacterium]
MTLSPIGSITAAQQPGDASAPRAGLTWNRILKLLPQTEMAAFLERSELVTVKSREILFEPGDRLKYVHFPEDSVISLVTVMADGDQVEAMTVGNDGFSGIPVFHGVETSPNRGIGQITGTARRVSVADFRLLAKECVALHRLLHLYSEFVYETVAQSAACNRLHVIEQRCARWLLMSQDRVGRDSFDLTQEFLAEMLGVRRPGVTVAMGILEKAGLIAHARGNITVINRSGLEGASCECYRTIRERQDRLIC